MNLVLAERLDVLVLIDNVTDSLSSTPSFVTREWARLQQKGMRLTTGGALCCANHGLSLVITAHGPNGPRTMLFDGGPVDYAVERNGVLPMDPIPTPKQWHDFGAEPIVMDAPRTCLDDLFYIGGEIPRITGYETGLPTQVRRVAPDASWEADPLLMDERFLAVHVRGKGLVVFSACSHAGIVNVLRHARDCFPDVKLHAVMGGFHLSGSTEAIIPQTVADLGDFGLDLIIPAHCTGWRAVNALERAYGEAVVVPAAVGKLFSL